MERIRSTSAVLGLLIGLAVMGWAIVVLPVGCGGPRQHVAVAERTTRVADAAQDAVDTAREAFLAWDAQHQLDIADRALSLDDGVQQLETYRADRRDVVSTFQVAYAAVAAVASLIPLVDAGRATDAELIAAIVSVADAIETMRRAVAELMRSP